VRRRVFTALGVTGLLIAGCQQPADLTIHPSLSNVPESTQAPPGSSVQKGDTLTSLRQLANEGIEVQSIEELPLPASVGTADASEHVLDIVFNEGVFFDFDKDFSRPEAAVVLDQMAGVIRSTAPNAAVTVLGHTDAIGTDAYNIDLSRRRAANVMAELIKRGVNPGLLSTVAIGKRQPLASNATPEGRALNRRVEFLISSRLDANLAVLRERPVNPGFRSPDGAAPRSPMTSDLEVLTPNPGVQPRSEIDPANLLVPTGVLHLQPVQTVAPAVLKPFAVAAPAPLDRSPLPVTPSKVSPAPLLSKPVPYSE
jgi:outer membrane protein OmpA-like peptidoglycan-associated protein